MVNIAGWTAVVITTALGSLWAFWGAIENFHEGWYFTSIWRNLGMMFAQYLIWGALFGGLGAVAVQWPRAGAALFAACAVLIPILGIRTLAAVVLVSIPLMLLGALYFIGRPRPRKWALRIVTGVPLLVMLLSGAGIAIRVSGRISDGDVSRPALIEGNGVRLIWAPEGPGWPAASTDTLIGDWEHTRRVVSRLNDDGRSLAAEPVHIWRLPTVDEVVRSQVRHGSNAGGSWDPMAKKEHYRVQPDKEWPLWKDKSPIIYWWTADAASDSTAYRVVYNGLVNALPKRTHAGYLGYRAVREVE